MADEFSDYSKVYSVWGYTLLKTPYDKIFPLYEELALLLTTSGSTGSPKFVRQSYANIRANTESIVKYLEIDATERPITTLPMSYTYGLSIINSHLWVGASIILTQKTLMQKEFWQQFKDYGATSFGGVPYIYEMLEKLRFFRMDLPSLHTMTQAGGKLSPELHKKFAEYAQTNGKKFVVMYGQTEATARMSYLPVEKSLEKYGSMGIAIPGGEFSLIDIDGKEIMEPEVVGELVYKGTNVTLGYAKSGADLAKGDERSGVLVTGDMAKRDADGFYYIVGRKKRFLKIFGSRVNLDETERLINGAFEGLDCACGGVDDKMTVFITNAGVTDKVMKFLTEKTGINRAAFMITVIDRIPRSESGKILYSELNKIGN
ncbi:MAG: AMP-binding protein [Treponema sp.]|nr:AMP-binding protein [Treponema sp.]